MYIAQVTLLLCKDISSSVFSQIVPFLINDNAIVLTTIVKRSEKVIVTIESP